MRSLSHPVLISGAVQTVSIRPLLCRDDQEVKPVVDPLGFYCETVYFLKTIRSECNEHRKQVHFR